VNCKSLIAGGFAFFALAAGAAAQPCQIDRYKDLVCGDGRDAVRVLPGTTSPSKRFAFGWRMKGGQRVPVNGPDREEDVENVLVRLIDGAVLATLGGHHWTLGDRHANQLDTVATWSADEDTVVETQSGRWSTEAQTYAAVAGDKAATLDLLRLFEPQIRAKMAKEFRDEYGLRVRSDDPATFEKNGRLRIGTVMHVPHVGKTRWFDVTLQISQMGGAPQAKVVSIKEVKGKP
jgi:hypothetical protein